MIRVLQTDGKMIELPLAASAELKGKEVVCYDRRGVVIARYPSEKVTIYGRNIPSEAGLESASRDAAGS